MQENKLCLEAVFVEECKKEGKGSMVMIQVIQECYFK